MKYPNIIPIKYGCILQYGLSYTILEKSDFALLNRKKMSLSCWDLDIQKHQKYVVRADIVKMRERRSQTPCEFVKAHFEISSKSTHFNNIYIVLKT